MTLAVKPDTGGQISFCSYGVKVEVKFGLAEFSKEEFIGRLKVILPTGFDLIHADDAEYKFEIITTGADGNLRYGLFLNGEKIAVTKTKPEIFERLETNVRLTIAEFAVGKVFLHAGVIGWKGKALILPGKSFHGKTTLVSELVKKGAEYFSDEYAILDEEGLAHPFPKMLSMRGIIDNVQQKDLPVEVFGGKAAVKPLEVGLILLTEFEKNAVWKPETMKPGEGILEILSHTIPIRYKPQFSLKVLNKITNRAIIAKTRRGEAGIFADVILDFFEKQAI